MGIVAKKKLCFGCDDLQYIYKQDGKNRYCLPCWKKKLLSGTVENKKLPVLHKRSDKRIRLDAAYKIIRDAYLKSHPLCEANIKGVCSGQPADQIHHRKGTLGELYLDDRYFLAVELNCHRWITDNPKEAIELGFSELRLNKH